MAFFASGGFAGESFISRTKPGERRFLEFGTDLDVEVEAKQGLRGRGVSIETKTVQYSNGAIHEHFLRHRCRHEDDLRAFVFTLSMSQCTWMSEFMCCNTS